MRERKINMNSVGIVIVAAMAITLVEGGAARTFELQTYNVGLNIASLGDMDHAARVDAITEAVTRSSADVLLLQDVWGDGVIEHICDAVQESGVETELRHCTSFLDHEEEDKKRYAHGRRRICGKKNRKLTVLLDCVDENTDPEDTPEEAQERIWEACNPIIKHNFGGACLRNAFIPCAHVFNNNTLFRECIESRIESGFTFGSGDLSSSTRGFLLLSKTKIKKSWAVPFVYPSEAQTISDKGLLVAKIKGVGLVVGTTLTQDNSFFFDYTSAMTSWMNINNWETWTMFEYIRKELKRSKPIIMGGLNSGPEILNTCPNVTAKFVRNFRITTRNGYKSVLVHSDNKQCTLCSENPLTEDLDDSVLDTMADHILIPKGSGYRAKDVKVLVNTMNRDDEAPGEPFSPHYGVSAVIRRRR